jgi:antitoxin ParD1/3/4
MPTRNVNLTPELDQFVASKVKEGLYANASEVMRTGLRLLEREEREYEEKMAVLRAAIDDGLASGVAEPGVFERLDAYIEELAAEEEECRRTA